ncbi:bola protein [Mycena leptocephala]|nr:bola protein [Mycena leptocephala]
MYALSTRRWLPAALRLRRFSDVTVTPTNKEQIIYNKLTERFSPSQLQIADISGGCGTFFAITIASEAFKGIPMVKQHQLVTQTIKAEIEEIHGLQVRVAILHNIPFQSLISDKNNTITAGLLSRSTLFSKNHNQEPYTQLP